MPRFFFHLTSPGNEDRDDVGNEMPDVEAAYLEAHAAAVEMITDMMRERVDPFQFQFEIFDQENRFLIELSFAEVVRSGVRPIPSGIRSTIRSSIRRGRKLRLEIREQVELSRHVIASSRAILARSRAI